MRPLVVANDYAYHVSFRRYRPLKLPLRCEVLEKSGVLATDLDEEGNSPDFGHAFSNCTHFRACGQFWFRSVLRVWRVADKRN